MKIGSIVFRRYEFEKMVRFWQEALHYVPRKPASDGWVVLRDPSVQGPNISLDKVRENRTGKRSRLHLDLYTNKQEEEVERLLAMVLTVTCADIVPITILLYYRILIVTSFAWFRLRTNLIIQKFPNFILWQRQY